VTGRSIPGASRCRRRSRDRFLAVRLRRRVAGRDKRRPENVRRSLITIERQSQPDRPDASCAGKANGAGGREPAGLIAPTLTGATGFVCGQLLSSFSLSRSPDFRPPFPLRCRDPRSGFCTQLAPFTFRASSCTESPGTNRRLSAARSPRERTLATSAKVRKSRTNTLNFFANLLQSSLSADTRPRPEVE